MKQQGISPWVWIGAAVAVLVLGALGLLVAGGYVFKQQAESAARLEGAPVVTIAEGIAVETGDVRVVGRDEQDKAVTLRHNQTDERIVLQQAGRQELRIRTEVGSVSVPWTGSTGFLGLASLSKDARFLLGRAADPETIPEWVPRFPGSAVRPLYVLTTEHGMMGTFAQVQGEATGPVLAYFHGKLEELGFQDLQLTATGGSGLHPDGRRALSFEVSFEPNGSYVLVSYADVEPRFQQSGNR